FSIGCQERVIYSELSPSEKIQYQNIHNRNANTLKKCHRISNKSERIDCFFDSNDEDFDRIY
ncbi:hypothetical protein, partial [Proteus mirabilis]|uniref:hypothetical protein n=1 Tax=Proteus mirabilis TaxID=584 RepID=UPI001A92EFB2